MNFCSFDQFQKKRKSSFFCTSNFNNRFLFHIFRNQMFCNLMVLLQMIRWNLSFQVGNSKATFQSFSFSATAVYNLHSIILFCLIDCKQDSLNEKIITTSIKLLRNLNDPLNWFSLHRTNVMNCLLVILIIWLWMFYKAVQILWNSQLRVQVLQIETN